MTLLDEIKSGESRTLEFKQELPQDARKWVKTIVAFANGAGGKFVIGVNNQREFVGIPKSVDLFELKDNISDTIAHTCEPQIMFDITAENIENVQLLVVTVFPGNATPYYVFLDKKEYEGPLCEQIDGAYKFVLNYLSMAVEINGIVRKERYELPPKAIRELIINAVIHRNYQMSSSVQVAVYDDRVEISSPGSIYGSLTLEEALSGRSSVRNRTLARTLEKIDVVEGWGTGFKRIFSQCDEYGVKRPEFLEIGDMLRVNFYRPSYTKIGDKSAINTEVGDKSVINTKIGDKSAIKFKDKILEYLKDNTEAKTQDISLYIGLKLSRTKDYLSELVEEGKIVANGANKNRTYSLVKERE